jgi:hypothetical protein
MAVASPLVIHADSCQAVTGAESSVLRATYFDSSQVLEIYAAWLSIQIPFEATKGQTAGCPPWRSDIDVRKN